MDMQAARQIISNIERVERLERTETPAGFTLATSFPSSPASGDRVMRTDRQHILYTYDGTQWLGPEESVVWSGQRMLVPAAANGSVFAHALDPDYLYFFTRAVAYTSHTGAPMSANYWTVALRSQTSVPVVTTYWTFVTSGDTSGVRTKHSTPTLVFSPLVTGASDLNLYIDIAKTGAPGNIGIDVDIKRRLIG